MKEMAVDNLEELLDQHSKVIVQYGASWCGVCRILKPKFSELAEQNNEIVFVYIDAEKLPNSRQFAKVDNLPTFAGFSNGKLVKQTSGSKVSAIEEVIHEVTSN